MAAGIVIHNLGGEQDIRKMGGLAKKMPLAFWTFAIGTVAISGVPPFAGFFSKDAVIDAGIALHHPLLTAMLIVAALLTAFYMFRLLFSTFAGDYRGSHEPHVENVLTMNVPVVVLAGLATIGGFFAAPLAGFLSGSFNRFGPYLLAGADHRPSVAEINWPVAAGMFLLAVAGIAAAYALYVVRPSLRDGFKRALAGPRELLLNAYYLDTVYHVLVEVPAYAIAGFCAKYFEPAVIDGIPRAMAGVAGVLGDAARGWESGQLRRYGLTIAIGVVLLLAYYAFVMHAGQAPEATMAR